MPTIPYTIDNLEADILLLISELSAMRKSKGHDYSGSVDTLDNLRDFGWKGIVVRLGDKYKRLKHFVLSGGDLKVKDEKIEDTLKDLINYSLYALILYRQERDKPVIHEAVRVPRIENIIPWSNLRDDTKGDMIT